MFFWFLLYVVVGMVFAYWIYRDGEFRPVDTAVYMIAAILLWPIVVPAWIAVRPPSQIKDLTFNQSYGHFKQWQRTHKVRDICDIDNIDKTASKGNGARDEASDEVMGQTSPNNPYVIGGSKSSRPKPANAPPQRTQEDDYGWEELDDRAPTYEIGSTQPRQVYNPFKKNNMNQDIEPEPLVIGNGSPRSKSSDISKKDPSSFNVPSISDILDNSSSPSKKESHGPFRDSNVRKLIDDGRLRDAYRVARRMLKVAQELGEEDRTQAYQRYLREIENRMKAAQDRSES